MSEDTEDYESGLICDACGASLDPDDEEQYHEPTGWYFCPECGHSNAGE